MRKERGIKRGMGWVGRKERILWERTREIEERARVGGWFKGMKGKMAKVF